MDDELPVGLMAID